MAYTFNVSGETYDYINQFYEDIGFKDVSVFRVGKFIIDNTVQHVLRPSDEAIEFMTYYIGDKPHSFMPTKPVWTNFKYVAKVHFDKKRFDRETTITRKLKKRGILCPDIIGTLYSPQCYIFISEYVGENIGNDELWSQYKDEYYQVMMKIKKLGYIPDCNPENYCVKDGKLYVIDFESWI